MTNPSFQRSSGLLPLGAMIAAFSVVGLAHAQEKTLPTIDVREQRADTVGYQARKSTIGKTEQDLKDIPQSVTVVTESLIQDRNADTLKEALRNVAGLTFNAGEGGRIGDNVTLRGYSLVGDLYLDGIRDIAQYNREVFNVQRVDVMRGSASMLFGRGSTGGVINQVSKTAQLESQNQHDNEASITIGSDAYQRALLDVNQEVGKNAAVRLNVMKTRADSFREGVSGDRWGVAPSFSWGLGTNDEFNVSYYRLKSDGVPDMGVPYFQGKPLDVPVERFYGLSKVDYQREDTRFITASWVHHFEDDSQLKTVIRRANYDRDLWAVAPRLAAGTSIISPSSIINRNPQRRAGIEQTTTSQTDYTRELITGSVRHQFLAGVELLREEANRWNWLAPSSLNPTTTVGNPNPNPTLAEGYGSKTRTGEVSYTGDTIGLYAQDFIELSPYWKLLIGARHDDFKADYERAAPAGPLTRRDRVWSYRTGLIYQPNSAMSFYGAWGTSFNPSAELYALDDRATNTPPEKNRNIELGMKWDALDGDLSLRAALFRSEKTNERNTDLAVSIEQNLLSGKRHTDGIEFELAGRLTPEWEVFGGLALMNAKIDAAAGTQANTLGKRPLNTPDHTANIWTTYQLSSAWKIGGGIERSGKRYGNNTESVEAPAYTRVDALVEFSSGDYALKMNVFNLFNTRYYEGVYSAHVVPGTTRTLQLTLTSKF